MPTPPSRPALRSPPSTTSPLRSAPRRGDRDHTLRDLSQRPAPDRQRLADQPVPARSRARGVGTVARKGPLVTHLDLGARVGVGWQCGSCLQCEWCERGDENLCATIVETCVDRHGGFADRMRVDGRFAFAIPDSLSSEVAAPLLCGGITVYSPLRRVCPTSESRGYRSASAGSATLAIRFARAFGCEVTAFSSTADERRPRLGPTARITSSRASTMRRSRRSGSLWI